MVRVKCIFVFPLGEKLLILRFRQEHVRRFIYLFDLQKQLSPSSVEQQKLMLHVTGYCFVTGLNQEVSCIIHSSMLIHPVRKIAKKLLEKQERIKIYYNHYPTGYYANELSHPFGVLWLSESPLRILQPGLQRGHAAVVPQPVTLHLLQHGPHAPHLHRQTPPLITHFSQEQPYHSLN